MHKHLTTALLAAALMAAPLVGFAAAGTEPAKTPANHAAHAAATHSTRGIVKSIDAATLVITRTGKMAGEMTFAVNPATHLQGTVAVGTSVAVRYHEDGKDNVATAISAQQPKQEKVHAAAPKP
jgi:hypothetical protein